MGEGFQRLEDHHPCAQSEGTFLHSSKSFLLPASPLKHIALSHFPFSTQPHEEPQGQQLYSHFTNGKSEATYRNAVIQTQVLLSPQHVSSLAEEGAGLATVPAQDTELEQTLICPS